MNASIPRSQSRLTFAVLVVAFLAITSMLGWEVLALRRALLLVDHTDEVISADREIARLTIDLETGVRGFLLTKDEAFLEPYREARVSIESRFSRLDQLVRDNPAQLKRLAEMRASYADWVRQSDPGEVGTQRPAVFFAENSRADVQLRRKAQMDRIRAEHLAFASIEEELRRKRFDDAQSGTVLVNLLLSLVFVLGAGAAILGMKQAMPFAVMGSSKSGAGRDGGRDWKEGLAGQASMGNWKTWMRPVAMAIGLPLTATLISIPLRPYSPYPFVLFYATVSIVAWVEGLWWGFLSLALSLALADFFLIPPYGSFVLGFDRALGLLLCGCVQLFICWLIDNQKQTADAMRAQADLLDLSHDGIMVRELDGQVRFWSHGAEEMYGFSKQEAAGKISHELLHTLFPQPLAGIEADLAVSGRWEGELGHTARDGAHIVVDSRWVLQKFGNGNANRVFEINSDITQRKRAEAESLKNTEALMRSNENLDIFAYAASHDLKAPLRVICNAAKWLEEDLAPHLTGATRENMALLRGRAARMGKLLDDLLEYSRIGRTSDKQNAEILCADELLEDILQLLSPPGEFAVCAGSTLTGVRVNRMPLQQVLINLISNAIKHHDKKTGRIDVSVRDLGTQLEFAVRDDGPGIPEQFQEQVFKMFQTLKPRDKVEGSGMGLAMVRKYVEVSSGVITLESAAGQGCTFRFTWPKLEQVEGETE